MQIIHNLFSTRKNMRCIDQIFSGPILEVAFSFDKMSNIYKTLVVKGQDIIVRRIDVTCDEVQQLLRNI